MLEKVPTFPPPASARVVGGQADFTLVARQFPFPIWYFPFSTTGMIEIFLILYSLSQATRQEILVMQQVV